MNRRVFCLIFFFVFFGTVFNVYAAGSRETYVERRNFSIAIPETWEMVSVRELRFNVLRGAFVDGFAPSINFVDEIFEGDFDEYVRHVLEEIVSTFGENFELILQTEFITYNDLRGELIVITTYQQDRLIQLNFFLFPGSDNRNMIITCTNLAIKHERYNELFINTVRTFKWLR